MITEVIATFPHHVYQITGKRTKIRILFTSLPSCKQMSFSLPCKSQVSALILAVRRLIPDPPPKQFSSSPGKKKKITVISKHFGLTEEKNFNCTIATTNHRALSEKTMY